MPSLGSRFRVGSVLASGALALHQLRYLLVYGNDSQRQLTFQGHEYVAVIGPVLAAVLLFAAIEFLVRIARAERVSCAGPTLPSGSRLWALASGLLLLVYCCQEWLEGQIEPGHPAGLTGIFGHGGWLAALLAVGIGGLVTLVLRGAGAALELAARRGRRRVRQTALPPQPCPSVFGRDPGLDVLAFHLAGRGPPALRV